MAKDLDKKDGGRWCKIQSLATLPRGVLRPRTLCVSPRDLAQKIRLFTYGRKYKLVLGFKGESSMLRSGFVLAGANHPNANPNNDGYLTAAEAAELQLEGT